MDFMHVDLDRDIDRLVQESPLPKDFLYSESYLPDPQFFPKNLSYRPGLPGHSAVSATARLKVSSTASPLARFNSFRSSQGLPLSTSNLLNESTQSVADVFNSLKNSSSASTRETSLRETHPRERSLILNHRGNGVSSSSTSALSSQSREISHEPRLDVLSRVNNSKRFTHTVPRQRAVATASHCETGSDRYDPYVARKAPARGLEMRDFEETFEHHFDRGATEDNGNHSNLQEEEADDTWSDNEPEACSLYMWIIKPVPGMAAVRIEGKKSLTDTVFWMSGIISRRINEKVVETKSGSIYRLEGNMELMDAVVSGFSRSTAEAFWLGFPADWEQLIQDHYNCHQHSREPTVEFHPEVSPIEEEEICVIETWDNEDSDMEKTDDDGKESVDIGLPASTIDGILDSLDKDITGVESASRSNVTRVQRGYQKKETSKKQPKTSTVIKPKEVKSSKADKECVLTNWIIKPLPVGGGVHVLGINQSGIMWNSSAIERRLAKNRLMTTTGGVYKLKGKMDTLMAIQQGIPKKMIEKFKNGFPKEWQELLQETMTEKTNTRNKKVKSASVSSSRVRSRTRDKTPAETPIENIKKICKRTASHTFPNAEILSTTKKNKARKENQHTYKRELSKSVETKVSRSMSKKDSLKQVMPDADKPKNVGLGNPHINGLVQNIFLTPNGDLFDLTNLQRSRSGRLVKPPLYWWAGQRICQGEGGYFVKTRTEYADRYCQEFEDRFWSTGKKRVYLKHMKASEDKESSIIKESLLVKKKMPITKSNKHSKPVETNKHNRRTSRHTKSENVSETENHVVKCDTTAIDSLDSTLESAVSEKGENILETTLESEVSKKIDERLDTTVESDKSGNGDDFPDIEKEIKVVLQRLATPKKKTRNSSTPCYKNCSDVDKQANKGENLYGIDSLDEEDRVRSKSVHQKSGKSKKDSTSKGQVKHNQVSIVSSTTDDLQNIVYPSPRRTRSSLGRHRTVNNSTEAKQQVTGEEDCSSSRTSRRSSRKVEVDLENDLCEKDNQNNSAEVPLVKSTAKTKSNKQKSSKADCRDAVTKPVPSVKSALKKRLNEPEPEMSENTTNELDTFDDYVWTAGDKERLSIALRRTSVRDPNYWEKLAEVVGTKSAISCQEEFYRMEKEGSVKKTKKAQETAKPKVTALTANKGTLKRRRQFTTLLSQHNENHTDNLFQSTPFRNTRKRKLSIEDIEGEQIFGEPSKRNGKSRFETPKGDVELGRRVFPKFVSAKKTPKSNLDLSEREKREDVDGYLHKILKKGLHKKGKRKRMTTVTPLQRKQVCDKVTEDSPHQKLFQEFIRSQQSDSENHVDSDQEQDYYWDADETLT